MTLKYKILATNPADNSVEVRFYTDQVTEADLACEWDDHGNITRCRTDYNINLPVPAPLGTELEAYIIRHAPTTWFQTLVDLRPGNNDPVMTALTAAVGSEFIAGQTAIDVADGMPNDGGALDLAWFKEKKKRDVAAWRFRTETGGVLTNGVLIRTDRESQATLTGAMVSIQTGLLTSVNWKTADGTFVVMSAAEITAIATAVAQHVQSSFDAEKAYVDQINACTTIAEVQAIVVP